MASVDLAVIDYTSMTVEELRDEISRMQAVLLSKLTRNPILYHRAPWTDNLPLNISRESSLLQESH